MSNTIRTFIAIPLAPEIRKTIVQIQIRLKELDCHIKWVNPENIHLTLKFLGDVKLKKLDTVKKTLEEVFTSTKSIQLELARLGAFPNIEHPRILWVGLKDHNEDIARLLSLLEDECGKIGFKKEVKPFSPHITFGRVRSQRNLNLLSEAISNYQIPGDLTQTGRQVMLFKSTLTAQGPVYEILEQFTLDKHWPTAYNTLSKKIQ